LTAAGAQNNQPEPIPAAKQGISNKQAYIIFGIVSLALIMAAIDNTIVSVSLPAMLTDLHTNLAYVGWTITGYQFSQCIAMPIVGKLSDEWGRKRIFLGAVLVFTASSLAAGFAPNVYWLILFRILQGAGGGSFMPSATGIISECFTEKRRTSAIGLFNSIFPIGSIIGPNLGGFLVDHFSWRWIFFVNIPIGAVLLLLGTLILPKFSSTSTNHRIDLIGAGLFSAAILCILYAITDWANNPGQAGVLTWLLFAAGAVLIVFFIRHESKFAQPMIELKLLKWRPFLAANIYNFMFGFVALGFFSLIPYYATLAYGMTAEQNGLLLTPRSISMIVVSAITSLFIIRSRYRAPMIAGLIIMSLGLFLLSRGYHDIALFGLDFQNLALLSVIVALGGIGSGIANPASNNAILDLMPEKVAAVIGLRGMFRVTGGVLGTALVVLILSHYQDKGIGFQQISLVFAIFLLLIIPVVFLIPDSARERQVHMQASRK
jgi:EmrB/QacA subfamily drug resistance transporter